MWYSVTSRRHSGGIAVPGAARRVSNAADAPTPQASCLLTHHGMPVGRWVDSWSYRGRRAGGMTTVAILLVVLIAASSSRAALVTFAVSSPQGTITQDNVGSNVSTVTFGDIDIANGTFDFSNTFPAFGIGLNPTIAPTEQWFFSQNNNDVSWFVSSGVIPILTAGSTVGSGGTYTSSDPNFAAAWRAGVTSGYAGLRMTSGSDFYYGYATIDFVAGSPNQATVTSFAFENQLNTAVIVPEPNMLFVAGCLALGGFAIRRASRLVNVEKVLC